MREAMSSVPDCAPLVPTFRDLLVVMRAGCRHRSVFGGGRAASVSPAGSAPAGCAWRVVARECRQGNSLRQRQHRQQIGFLRAPQVAWCSCVQDMLSVRIRAPTSHTAAEKGYEMRLLNRAGAHASCAHAAYAALELTWVPP